MPMFPMIQSIPSIHLVSMEGVLPLAGDRGGAPSVPVAEVAEVAVAEMAVAVKARGPNREVHRTQVAAQEIVVPPASRVHELTTQTIREPGGSKPLLACVRRWKD